MRKLLDYDPDTRVAEWYVSDPASKKWHIEYVQDVEAILDRNKALQNHNDGYSKTREWRRTATIPNIIAMKWLKELGVNVYDPNHAAKVKRLLNDPDWRWLKSITGRV